LVKPRPSSLEDQSILNKQDLTRSPKSDGGTRKTDRRARYWKFLFDNLQRAVDAIYETCEQDESVVECKVNVYHLVHMLYHLHDVCHLVHMLSIHRVSDITYELDGIHRVSCGCFSRDPCRIKF
jgi:hypothetical protein